MRYQREMQCSVGYGEGDREGRPYNDCGYSFFNEMPEFCFAAFFSFSISFFCLLDFGGLFCAFFCSLFAMISSFPYVTEIKTDTTLTLLRVLYQI